MSLAFWFTTSTGSLSSVPPPWGMPLSPAPSCTWSRIFWGSSGAAMAAPCSPWSGIPDGPGERPAYRPSGRGRGGGGVRRLADHHDAVGVLGVGDLGLQGVGDRRL